MTIQLSENVPEGAWEAAHWKVSRLLSWGALFVGDLAPPEGAQLKLVFPHRIYWLSRYDIIESQASLRQSVDERGWRFLVANGDKVLASIQTWYRRGTWQVSSAQTGLASTGMTNALNLGHADGEQAVEACYLWIRTKWTAALWLRPPSDDDGKVIPLTRPNPERGLTDGAAFLSQLREQLRQPSLTWPG